LEQVSHNGIVFRGKQIVSHIHNYRSHNTGGRDHGCTIGAAKPITLIFSYDYEPQYGWAVEISVRIQVGAGQPQWPEYTLPSAGSQ
jgi:hypothetical protein